MDSVICNYFSTHILNACHRQKSFYIFVLIIRAEYISIIHDEAYIFLIHENVYV